MQKVMKLLVICWSNLLTVIIRELSFHFLTINDGLCFGVISAVPKKHSSHYMKGLLIGLMSIMGLLLILLLVFLWIWLLSKKERAAKRYTEVKKQVHRETSQADASKSLCSIVFIFSQAPNLVIFF